MISEIEKGLHPKNKHQGSYDFDELKKVCPNLGIYLFTNKFGNQTIDFF
jgi:23S rRNA (adenine1618-N6)-methyltransferase